MGLEIEGANRHDMKLVTASLCSVPQSIEERRLEQLATGEHEQGLCLDAGYDYDEVHEIAYEFGYTAHLRNRGEEKKAKEAGKKARRWVVERTHSWMNGYGKLRRCTEKDGRVVDFYLFLAATLVVVRMLIQRARTRYRWPTRPTTRRLK